MQVANLYPLFPRISDLLSVVFESNTFIRENIIFFLFNIEKVRLFVFFLSIYLGVFF